MSLKSPFCQHQNGCVYDIAFSSAKLFCIITAAKFSLNSFLKYFQKREKSAQQINNTGDNQNSNKKGQSLIEIPYQSGLFAACLIGSFKFINCFLRHIRQTEDKYNSIIAGGISGYISLNYCEQNLKQEVVLFVLSRALIVIFGSTVDSLQIQFPQYFEVILLQLLCAILQNAVSYKPQYVLDNTYNTFFTMLVSGDQCMLSYLRELALSKERKKREEEKRKKGEIEKNLKLTK